MIASIIGALRALTVALVLAAYSPTAYAVDMSGALAIDELALRRLERAAAYYQEIAPRTTWPSFADGAVLRPGETDPRVAALRKLLTLTRDLALKDSEVPNLYTPELADAVRAFQTRHGLTPDAVVGRKTRAALALTAVERARLLSLSLERLRQLNRRLPAYAVVVNIPAFALTVLSNGQPEWQTQVIVGRPSWPTPTFDSVITRIELNPYWNVPPSIARRELVPLIASDRTYLARHDMKVLSGYPGVAVDPALIDWRRFGASGYRLRQDPGPNNPLGHVKFQIPNPHDVYLHDTPGKRSFALDMRALSHGCIRVENAMELAARLLASEPNWSAERLHAEVATGRPVQIALARSVPVAIVYVTAWIDPRGTLQFRPDLYGRDARTVAVAEQENCGTGSFG